MSVKLPTIEEMFNASLHFGHKKGRSDPRFKKYIWGIREGVYIIDLEKTNELFRTALDFLRKLSKEGKTILFVGTKRQVKDIIEEAAKKTQMPYITHRWLGGTLTNFTAIQHNIQKLVSLEDKLHSEKSQDLTKKEKIKIEKKLAKLHLIFDGLISLKRLPDCLFVFDTIEESIAVKEAKRTEIPIVGVCDSNSNPNVIDYPIPSNDDARKAAEMIIGLVRDTILEGKE